jgi:hypothetical protein
MSKNKYKFMIFQIVPKFARFDMEIKVVFMHFVFTACPILRYCSFFQKLHFNLANAA